jgi:hypothetical protein
MSLTFHLPSKEELKFLICSSLDILHVSFYEYEMLCNVRCIPYLLMLPNKMCLFIFSI